MGRRKKMSIGTAIAAIVLLPVAVPIKMATDILKAERRAKNRKKGRRR